MLILFDGILIWNKSRFSEEKMMAMVETPTKLKGLTSDYCKFRTSLEPKEPDERAVRIIFKCGDKQALNIISWETMTEPTVGSLINEVINIHGYINRELVCKVDGQKANYDFILNPGNLIICET